MKIKQVRVIIHEKNESRDLILIVRVCTPVHARFSRVNEPLRSASLAGVGFIEPVPVSAKNIFRTKILIGQSLEFLTMDILASAFVIILAIAVAAIIYYLLKNVLVLVVNAVVGVIVLFLLNLFHVMSLAGASDLPIDWITVLVSAIGGMAGVIIVIVLHLAGVVL
jgi:hypothetical protein